MISIITEMNDSFRLQGIRHFIEKSGIPIAINRRENSRLCIQYTDVQKGEFSICIKESYAQNSKPGIISAFNTQVPIFQIPEDTGKGDRVIGYYENGEDQYPCMTRQDNRIIFGFDIFKEIGLILSGNLEKIQENLNENDKNTIASIPLLDIYEDFLFGSILEGCESLGLPVVRKANWPDGKRFALCLTHDVDELKKTYQWITRPLRYLRQCDLKGVKNQFAALSKKLKGIEPYWTFEEITRINTKHRVTSTFFFLKESAKMKLLSPETWHHAARCHDLRGPETIALMKRLSSEGNEIGLHGSYHSYNNPYLLSTEKEELEKVYGGTVTGIRQHHLNLDIPKTWQHQREIGLLYDTSLGFKGRPGFRFGTCFPFHPVAGDSPLELLEIPLAIMDITLHNRSDPWSDCRTIIDTVENQQGVLTLLWHPPVFNSLEYPGFSEIYDQLINVCIKKDAWVTGAGEIALWWKAREKSCLEYTVDQGLLNIVLENGDPRQDIEIYLPADAKAEIVSNNAEIIHGEKVYVRIRPREQSGRFKITVRVR